MPSSTKRVATNSPKDYLWLNARTVVFHVCTAMQEFYTIDAPTGEMKEVVWLPDDDRHRVVDFGVSGPQQFWYKTADGETHEVAVESEPQARQ